MLSQALAQFRALGPRQLAALAGVALLLLGSIAFLALRAGSPPMALLYADLDPRDAGAVVQSLDKQRIPYQLGAGGSTVMVPEEMVPKLRLALAREGLPAGGNVGWEIFDRGESLTTTPFQQDMNRIRALEGELARTIRGLSGVRNARVHLVLPQREAFSRRTNEAQASVVLSMLGSQRLDREGVQAVLHLVATAVPGLKLSAVSIIDSRGELLARGGEALTGPAAASTQEEMRHAQELRIARGVEELLERTLGAGKVRAEATVELDSERVQTTEERYDPDNQVARSTQSTQEQSRSGEGGNNSVSVANQLPGAEAAGGNGDRSQESRTEETTNYEIGKTVRSALREGPVLKRLSVAVLVDGVYEPQPEGAPKFRERTPEELQRLTALVRGAVGADERRGDRVELVSMRFAASEAEMPQAAGGFLNLSPALAARLIESGVYALIVLLALLLVARPLVRRITVLPAATAALPAAGAAAAAVALDAPEGRPALPPAEGDGGEAMISLTQVDGQIRASSISRLGELVDTYPDETLALVRRWLAPAEVEG
ncbi:Flagellar M-ring protein FliF [Roseomonas mucosa]|uniref:Flagellar M-ring protein n=1 Tax=Roseomonas mucosa TaxID=207340 RepID=A0A379N1M0_9PROT|nr:MULTISPECIES: flagellar basal-body MS-ring/collar protein FliF [Roseomonas]MCG7354573.1 flagellar M-ring protein FliF [Roseomonas mucosa]MCG7359495.1 flagellar M-ring protein FliF [Roseomonas mucosa]MDT8288679.1 flagellar basal-body MS-ring/collar protein FliF [Roseomonas mucosa]MDT8292663.1 flagellar basal-body MS-ring/collar protein FliF [Roseomonas mucosa]MDT8313145.1 flagellar basal-body MS-ring/collar protein FliF [Roseomonas mucosa]